MNDYICPHCHATYKEEDLIDNEDGTCIYCGCPLEAINGESYLSLYTLGKENPDIKFIGKGADVQNMIKNLRMYSMDEVWHNIEKLKNVKDRVKERRVFFQALKKLNLKFELWE